jgi:hypothetical protein
MVFDAIAYVAFLEQATAKYRKLATSDHGADRIPR